MSEITSITDGLIKQFIEANSSLNDGESPKDFVKSIAVGIVVNTDDPLEEGRLMVFCPEFNDSPKKIHQLPWASYCTPYGGSINNGSYARGNQVGLENSSGAIHYGFWGIPEQGAHVLLACINGDIQRRVWLGCLPEHQETHTLFNGRFKWNGGEVDGPLTSTGSPIQPSYSNATEAFQGDRSSPEWKTRGADYQTTGVREDLGEVPSPSKSTYLDNQYPQMTEAEQDKWVKPKVGAHGYDWTGYKGLGAFKSSRVFGMSTPGFHSFSMDDRAFNSRIRLKTTAGHQVLLDDTNERIVISTYGGKASIEMDVNGNIDVYTDKRLSMHSKQDINIESDETVRIKGKKGIHMYSGDTTGQTELESTPKDGQIRMHAVDDIHVMSEKTLRVLTVEDGLFEYGRNVCTTVGGDMNIQVEGDINTIINAGDMNTSIDGSLHINATGNISQFAGNNMKHQAINNGEFFAYRGKMDIASQMDLNIKSKGENVAIESVPKSVTMSGFNETSMLTLNDDGIMMVTENNLKMFVKEEHTTTVSVDVTVAALKSASGPQAINAPLIMGAGGCLTFPGVTIKLNKDGKEEHDADDDITWKLPGSIEESVDNLNKKFDKIQTTWDNHMSVVWKQTLDMQAWVTDLFGGGNLVLELPLLPLPPLPPISFSLPTLQLPTLTLPDLCFDLTNILTIEGLELLPDSLFSLNVDLGGWTIDNIRGWVNGLRSEVDGLRVSFDNALNIIPNIQTQIDSVLDQLTNAVSNVNILSLNMANADIAYLNYNINIGDAITALEGYNTIVTGNGLPSVISMISELGAHVDSNNTIQSNIASGGLDSSDLSSLSDTATLLGEYVTYLGGGI